MTEGGRETRTVSPLLDLDQTPYDLPRRNAGPERRWDWGAFLVWRLELGLGEGCSWEGRWDHLRHRRRVGEWLSPIYRLVDETAGKELGLSMAENQGGKRI